MTEIASSLATPVASNTIDINSLRITPSQQDKNQYFYGVKINPDGIRSVLPIRQTIECLISACPYMVPGKYNGELNHYHNLTGNFLKGKATGILDIESLSNDKLELIWSLAGRQLLASDGHCIMPEFSREVIFNYFSELESLGLVRSSNLASNIIYIPNEDWGNNTDSVLYCAEKAGKRVQPYAFLPGLAKVNNPSVIFYPEGTNSDALAEFSASFQKISVRDSFQQGLNPQDRLLRCVVNLNNSVRFNLEVNQEETNLHATAEFLKRLLNYSREAVNNAMLYKFPGAKNLNPGIFIQSEAGDGGFGSKFLSEEVVCNIIKELKNCDNKTLPGEVIRKVANVVNFGSEALDLAPFVHIVGAGSIGTFIIKEEQDTYIICMGYRENVQKNNAYAGEALSPEMPPFIKKYFNSLFEQVTESAIKAANKGFTGPFAYDYLIYINENGKMLPHCTELNGPRFDATSYSIQVMLTGFDHLRDAYLSGNLSLRTDVYTEISINNYLGSHPINIACSTSLFYQKCAENGIEIFNKDSAYGVFLLRPPTIVGDNLVLGVAFYGSDDTYVDELRSKFIKSFAVNPKSVGRIYRDPTT
jgi:hypothetical protein